MGTDLNSVLLDLVDRLLEAGWYPADLVHATKRQFSQRTSRLVVACLAVHARQRQAVERAPEDWLDQLHELGVFHRSRGTITGGAADPIPTWARLEKLHAEDATPTAMEVARFLATLGRLSLLGPPPSQWPASNKGVAARPQVVGEVDAKMLNRVRALLAKAESTDFEEEAGAFTAKAQELMTRHSIDAAMLSASTMVDGGLRRGVVIRRVHIDDPYADEKSMLLGAIAEVNSVKCVWSPQAGFTTLVGFPVDVQLADLLFTSLLVQATHASAEATAHDRRLRSPAFKRAFMVAFADRVAERLEQTRQHVRADAQQQYGDSLLPVLSSRAAAVQEAFDEAFPSVTYGKARSYDARGWYAGRAAGDRADIGAGAALNRG